MNKQFIWWVLLILVSGLLVLGYQMRWHWTSKKIDYDYLQKLLASGQWKAADVETSKLILLKTSGQNGAKVNTSGVSFSNFADFPCKDLITIDQLWLKYSNNQFGFSIQQSIWQPTDTQITAQNILANQNRFREQVGWTNSDLDSRTYELTAQKGHLPSSRWLVEASPKLDGMNVYKLDKLLSRTKECYLQQGKTSD